MTWNFRVFRSNAGDGWYYFTIHEAYYNVVSDALPHMWTLAPVDVGGDSLESLRWRLERMLEALNKPVLESKSVPGHPDGELYAEEVTEKELANEAEANQESV